MQYGNTINNSDKGGHSSVDIGVIIRYTLKQFRRYFIRPLDKMYHIYRENRKARI